MLSVERLKELYSYNDQTGIFVLNVSRGPRKAGTEAGTLNKRGYLQIQIDGKFYLSHRLAWLYMTGCWPTSHIDHKDRDRLNNRFSNLRVVTQTTNNRNKKKDRRNSSGFTGVSWSKRDKKWYAYISVESKMISLGSYESIEDAVLARKNAEDEYGYSLDRVWNKFGENLEIGVDTTQSMT